MKCILISTALIIIQIIIHFGGTSYIYVVLTLPVGIERALDMKTWSGNGDEGHISN